MSVDEQKHAGKETAAVDLLSDEALDSVSIKVLRVAYRELRTFHVRKMVELQAVRDKIKIGTKGALGNLKQRGMKTGGAEPYGYQVGRDGKTLRPYRLEQRLIDTIVQLRTAGMSFHGIAVKLNERGERNRWDAPFQTKTITRIFRAAKLREEHAHTIEAKQGPLPRDP